MVRVSKLLPKEEKQSIGMDASVSKGDGKKEV